MQTPSKISPPRRELLVSTSSIGSVVSFSQSQQQQQKNSSSSSNNVRVVVRIRPMNAQERAQGSRSVLYPGAAAAAAPAVVEPEAELQQQQQQQQQPESPCSSVSSHNSLASRGRKVLSKLRRGKKKSATTADDSSSSNNNTDKATTDSAGEQRDDQTENNSNKISKIYPTICHAEMGSNSSNNNANNYANYNSSSNNKRLAFEFDAVYGPDTTQSDLYRSAIGDMITENVAAHYNTTIFAYGQTGSGKTHTMSCADGVVAKAVQDIFQSTAAGSACADGGERDDNKSKSQKTIHMSCLEIYAEELRDLLGDAPLRLRDHGEGVSVVGLRRVEVNSVDQVQELLQKATERRLTGATVLNERSSRSHAVYTITVTTATKDSNIDNNDIGDTDGSIMNKSNTQTAKLTLVDLAGSERITKTGVNGTQRKESININKDLFTLGKVVSSLSKKGLHHIPYRESKLTRLLSDALGGNCRTLLIACVSPADLHADESLNTLRYAERTRNITNNARPNISDCSYLYLTPNEIAALQQENRVLKARIVNLNRRISSGANINDSSSIFAERSMPGTDFSGLEIKLRRAREEAKATMDSCRSVASAADRVKQHRQKLSDRQNSRSSVTSSSRRQLSSGEMSDDSEAALTDRITALIDDKINLCDQILLLVQQMDDKNEELEQAQRDGQHQSQIRKDISQVKQQIRNLAGDLKENEECLQALLITLRGEQPAASTAESSATMPFNRPFSRVQRARLEEQCRELSQDIDFVNSENDILRHQNKRLQTELHLLRTQLEESGQMPVSGASTSSEDNDDDPEALIKCNNSRSHDTSDGLDGETIGSKSMAEGKNDLDELRKRSSFAEDKQQEQNEESSQHSKIRSRAEELLEWADRAIEKGSQGEDHSMCDASTAGTELRPRASPMTKARQRVLDDDRAVDSHFIISNMDQVEVVSPCPCQKSMFSANEEHVEFYLPRLRVICNCGKNQEREALKEGTDQSNLVNILRDWQVQFMKSIGIETAMQLVVAHDKRSREIAKEMRRWRKEKGLFTVRTKSCGIALRIWSRTCQAVLKAIIKQSIDGEAKMNILDISLSDSHSMSTLGFAVGSVSGY